MMDSNRQTMTVEKQQSEMSRHPHALAKNPTSRSLSSPIFPSHQKPKVVLTPPQAMSPKLRKPKTASPVLHSPSKAPQVFTFNPKDVSRTNPKDLSRKKYLSLGPESSPESPDNEKLRRRCNTLPSDTRSPLSTPKQHRKLKLEKLFLSDKKKKSEDVWDYNADCEYEQDEQTMTDSDTSPQFESYKDKLRFYKGRKSVGSVEDLRPAYTSPEASYLRQIEEIVRRERKRKKSIESPGRLQNQLSGLTLVADRKNGGYRLVQHDHRVLLRAQSTDGSPRLDADGRKSRVGHLLAQITRQSMKKVDSVPVVRKKPSRSPVMGKKPLSDAGSTTGGAGGVGGTGSLPGTLRVRGASNVSNDSYLSVSGSDVQQLSEDDTIDMYEANGSTLDMLDDTDGTSDPIRTKQAIEHLQAKIAKVREQIKVEQKIKEDNVNEYLRLASNADKLQVQRIKQVFEKKNSKSAIAVAQLQKKLENYQKRTRDLEMYGISSHKMPKEMLRDMGQGLKGVGANIRDGIQGFSGGVVGNIKGATETIVSKPREFASLIKNKFGSADNIRNLQHLDEGHLSTDEGERSHPGSETLPASRSLQSSSLDRKTRKSVPGINLLSLRKSEEEYLCVPKLDFKYTSDDEASSVTSGSGPSAGLHISPLPALSSNADNSGPGNMILPANIERLLMEEHEYREAQNRLQETIESFKTQMSNDYAYLKQVLDEERYRYERLEEQINDLTELHQHEMTNLKQELSSMEEKMEYQLDERTRDLNEMLETCQTRITKMELAQQQQQLISMEGVENANARALITKLINVVLAVLAVLLVLVSTIANILSPFITTRVRLLTTALLIVSVVLAYQHWPSIELLFLTLSDFFSAIRARFSSASAS